MTEKWYIYQTGLNGVERVVGGPFNDYDDIAEYLWDQNISEESVYVGRMTEDLAKNKYNYPETNTGAT